MALHLEDDVPDFPRGGGSSLSREELDEVRAEVDAEFEVEERLLKKRKKQNKMQRSSTEDDLGSLFGGGINGKLPRFANKITLKNISPGMKLWGVVCEINEKDIVVSLPGGLRGLVRASEAVPSFLEDGAKVSEMDTNFLSSVYHVGQLVSCIVLHLDEDKKEAGKRKIWLSLRLSLLHKNLTPDVIQEGMILSAYVKSMEDHGYIIHFGLRSFSGFMPKESENFEVKIRTGQLVQGVVNSIDRTRRVVYLSSDPDVVSKCVTKDLKGISIDLLVPGMMVNASVRSILENGIMLSFLTYFTGTADMFNLLQTFPSSNWKVDYPQNKKVNARILFIDPSTRAVGLTLNPHLVHNKASPALIKVGDIFDQSKVIRIDRGLGLLLEIPSSPVPTPAYVNVSDVADKEVKKLEKSFKEGKLVRVRVLGFRHLEGLATGVLKPSAFEGSVFTHSDVKPGMVVKAKVIAVDSFGAIVQFSSGVKALCPLRHMSEFEIVKPRKKFQVGAELVFRILGCKSKRITITHKKTLVKSKLEILGSYADATEGLATHGWITKIENHGCFVRFYNGVQGFAPRSELGLDPGCEISSMYHVEQVVKCRVTSSNPASRRINLSFTTTPSRGFSNEHVKPGNVISGVVERVTPDAIVLDVTSQGHFKGTISPQHLADHSGHAELMKSALRPGYEFDQLLVLDVEGSNLILSAKHSLVTSAQQLPLDVNQVHLNSVLHGYICNIIENGIFIRYLGRLTGFSPRNRATDDRRSSLSEVYKIGQSVRTNVVDVSSETSRITVSLKQSLCSSSDASFIQEYFLVEEKISQLHSVDSEGSDLRWVEQFNLGSTVKGKVHEIKEFGVVVSFQKYDDVFGFISHYQLGGTPVETGSSIRTAVLDVSKIERLVDLSLKPAFVNKSKKETTNSQGQKKRKGEVLGELEVNQTVNAVVEIVKENYLVVSLPSYNNTLGYASRADYNTQNFPLKSFTNGESVIATIMALPSPSTSGRLLLLLKSISEAIESSNSKRAKKKSSYNVGSLVQAEITEIRPLELRLKFGSSFHGRVHITEASDDNYAEAPFSNFRFGQTLTARIISKFKMSESVKRGYQWELSIKPSTLADPVLEEKIEDLHPNMMVQAYVKNVTPKGCFIVLSRKVDAKVLLSNLSDGYVENPEKEFPVGKLVIGKVVSVDPLSKRVEVTLRTSSAGGAPKSDKVALSNLTVGDVISGRVKRVEPYGLFITVDHTNLVGLCHVSEISDNHVDNIDSRHKAGDRVTAKILKVDKERHRISLGMKNSYFIDATIVQTDTRLSSGYAVNRDALSIGIESTPSSEWSSQGREDLDGDSVDGKDLFLAEVESRASIPPLEVSLDDTENLDMGGVVNQVSGDATDFGTSDDKNKKHAGKKDKRLREQEIRAAEERLLGKDIPRDEDEFEKLVRSSPNSSFVWIKYMAFVLSGADVEKARSIAERALRTINVREELEKLNVWVAYFNLENEYGNPPEEAVEKVFHRALQYCDPKKVHLALLGMYERTEQHKLVDELLVKMVKKFKHSCKVWLRWVQWLLKQNQDGVQLVVNRALLNLPPHKHINFITQTALLEFKCGVPDRGRSLFEKMLREYPKRTDLWSVYLDQEIRLGDADVIRALFERAITLSLQPKKMKFLFKKYLEYEKMLGDDERMEAVKRKAMEYVESSLA